MVVGTHGSTFGGNPLAMAVASAVMDLALDENFLPHVNMLGLKLRQKLAMLADQYPRVIESVRGEGLMLGLKCRVPNTDLVAALREEKMLTVGAGDNVVRLLPPLIIEEVHLEEAMEKLGRACAKLDAALGEKPAAAGATS
jgi:acetylornithine/N-succinyldiaminopimelate aminotransferase